MIRSYELGVLFLPQHFVSLLLFTLLYSTVDNSLSWEKSAFICYINHAASMTENARNRVFSAF